MRKEIIEAKPLMLGIDLDRPFPLGFGSLEHLPRVLLQISALDKGKVISGIGEASIDFPFSTYDAWDIYWALSQLKILGKNLGNQKGRKEILEDNILRAQLLGQFPAAFTALNMAIDDLSGKLENKPLLEFYGQERPYGKALASISFQDETALLIKEVEGKYANDFIPKPKVGQGFEQDFQTIKAVARIALDKRIPFVLDFNAQYKPEEFEKLIRALKSANVSLIPLMFIEQPTNTQSGIQGLVFAKEILAREFGYKIPVIADESFVTATDALKCAQAGISLNFKIHKVGGLYMAREIEDAIISSNKGVVPNTNMVGGTFPTAIGRTYDQQSGAALKTTSLPGDGWEPSTDWFTGDKHIIAENFHFDKRRGFSPTKGPGLGITPNWEKINKFVIANPKEEYRNIRHGRSGKSLSIELKPGQSYGEVYKTKSGRNPDWNLD